MKLTQLTDDKLIEEYEYKDGVMDIAIDLTLKESS